MKNKGFSLVELVVAISILAVFTAVLAPTMMSYTEKSRAAKDIVAMDEIVNAIIINASMQEIYDELLTNRIDGNVSCYIDKSSESELTRTDIQIDKQGETVQYIFGDDARRLDESKFFAAGLMRGVTITFERTTDPASGYVYIVDGVINKFSDNPVDIETCPWLCRALKQLVGEKVWMPSQTYKNSEITVFVRMGSGIEGTLHEQEHIRAYGQFSGTNLTSSDNQYQRATKDAEE